MERWVVIHSIGQGGRPPQGGSPRWRALLCTSWHVARSQLGRSTIFGGRVYCSSTLGTLFLGLLSVDTFPLQDLTEVPTPNVTTLGECRATTADANESDTAAHPGPIPRLTAAGTSSVLHACDSARLPWSTSCAVPLVVHARRSREVIPRGDPRSA